MRVFLQEWSLLIRIFFTYVSCRMLSLQNLMWIGEVNLRLIIDQINCITEQNSFGMLSFLLAAFNRYPFADVYAGCLPINYIALQFDDRSA